MTFVSYFGIMFVCITYLGPTLNSIGFYNVEYAVMIRIFEFWVLGWWFCW